MIKSVMGERLAAWIHMLFPFLFTRRLSPNLLTIAGTLLSIVGAVCFALGSFVSGGFLILAGGFFDLVDGAVARHTDAAPDLAERLPRERALEPLRERRVVGARPRRGGAGAEAEDTREEHREQRRRTESSVHAASLPAALHATDRRDESNETLRTRAAPSGPRAARCRRRGGGCPSRGSSRAGGGPRSS